MSVLLNWNFLCIIKFYHLKRLYQESLQCSPTLVQDTWQECVLFGRKLWKEGGLVDHCVGSHFFITWKIPHLRSPYSSHKVRILNESVLTLGYKSLKEKLTTRVEEGWPKFRSCLWTRGTRTGVTTGDTPDHSRLPVGPDRPKRND